MMQYDSLEAALNGRDSYARTYARSVLDGTPDPLLLEEFAHADATVKGWSLAFR